MKKCYFLVIGLIFLLAGCTENDKLSEEVLSDLSNNTNEQQTMIEKYLQELQQSEDRNRELTEEVEVLKFKLEAQDDYTKFIEGSVLNFQELLQNTHHVISQSLGDEEASKLLGVFNPNSVSQGSQIGKLTVKNVNIEKQYNEIRSYSIDFSGELSLSGLVSIDEAHGGYRFTIDNKHFTQVPYAMKDLKYGSISFKIRNDEVFEATLNEELSIGEYIAVHAVFDNYSSNFISESHMSNYATFIELIID